MMKKTVSLVMALILVLSMGVFAETKPSSWAESEIGAEYSEMFRSMQIDLDYQRPITRAEFAMLAFSVYKDVNGDLPQIQTKDIFQDIGEETVDMFVPMAAALGIVRGVSSTHFMPRNPLTRQELCTMLTRIFSQLDPKYAEDIAAAQGSADKFADSAKVADWAKDAVNYCISKEIIKGVSDTEISPLTNVTVEQAMVICNRIVSK